MKIETLNEAGVYQKDIAAQLEISPRSVARALARQGAPERSSPRKGKSKLTPYQSEVDRLIGLGVWNGTVILREITAKGYNYLRPGIEHRDWGANEMTLIDPFGNRLRLSEYDRKP